MANPMLDFLKNGKSKKKKHKEGSEPKSEERYEKGLSAKELKKAEAKEVG